MVDDLDDCLLMIGVSVRELDFLVIVGWVIRFGQLWALFLRAKFDHLRASFILRAKFSEL